MAKKKLAVIIGRFQPIHDYHIESLFRTAAQYDETLVLLGSAYQALTQKNPWSPLERAAMIQDTLEDHAITSKVTFKYLKDYPYSNNRWVLQVQKLVNEKLETLNTFHKEGWEVILVGCNKDGSSFYLNLFPQWKGHYVVPEKMINATDVRVALFENRLDTVQDVISPSTYKYLKEWIKSENGIRLQKEYEAEKRSRTCLAFVGADGKPLRDENGEVRVAPYKPIAYCTDSVVTWRGHVLLIRRRSEPGKGLWALPGGHLNPNEWVKEGAVRELQEETHIYFYTKDDRRRKLFLSPEWCRASHQFDYPGRSQNGRKITTAFHWVIPDEYEVAVQADDDADRAQWFSFYDVLEKMDFSIFEDHQAIIAHMILEPSL